MASNTPWWACSRCGFFNRPRPYLPTVTMDAKTGLPTCEQCGKVQDAVKDADYAPATH